MDPIFKEDMKKFLGLPPYDLPMNTCQGDAYFAKDLERRYGAPIKKLIERFEKEHRP